MSLSAQKGFAPIFLILGFLIALVGVGGFYYLNQPTLPIPKESPVNTVKPSQFAEGQETKVSGSVIKNYVEGLPIDAPAVLTIQTDDGKVEVEYHPGDAECKNTQAGDFGLTIKKGETVEVFGKFSLGRIRTCDSTQYYIHKLNSSTLKFLDQKQNNGEDNVGITTGEARKILPLQPSRVSVNKAGNIRTIKWPGTGRGDGYYTVYRKADSDKNWVKLSQVDVKGDDRGEYEYIDANSEDRMIYIYGLSVTNGLGTESMVTSSNPS